ncbi:MAG: PLP-dependent aminotransferase family protein [Bacillota bacterium]|nr:PLP-dependent aminotransferase family protein [Bacillota bacterium]
MKNNLFAKRMENIRASEIRELLKITEMPEVISFAGGLPAPELFPLVEIAKISSEVILEDGRKALQYSTTEGYLPLREKIAERLHRVFKTTVSTDQILITCGSQQALDFIGKVFLNEGDVVFCESPSYLGALNAFRAYEPRFIEVPTDDDGMIPEELEKLMLTCSRRKLIYVVPDFQNPTGRTWSVERRKKLLEIAQKYGVVIIEDNPYGELRFEGEIPASLMSLDNTGTVIGLGTFSKIFCPGMRLGWIAADTDFIEKFVLVKQGADLHTSTTSQMQVNRFLEKNDIDMHIAHIKDVYRERRDTVIEAMEREFPRSVRFTRPNGGLFTWAELPEGLNARKLLEISLERKVAFVPGASFYACRPKDNTMRINYSNMPEDRIREGIKRLGEAIYELSSISSIAV